MNILHVLSNFRWTERSEPAIDLVLAQRAAGEDVHLVCGRNRAKPEDSIEYCAGLRGVTPVLLDLPKHFKFGTIGTIRSDIKGLRRLVSELHVDLIHCHMENGWLLSLLATRTMHPRPLLFGHVYDPEGLEKSLRNRYLMGRRTDGIVVISETAKRNMVNRYRFAEDRIAVIEPCINVERFRIQRRNTRAQFGLNNEFVVGMVTQYGRRRRVDIVLEAISILAPEIPDLKLLLIGRGKMDLIVEQPARSMGIRDRIVFGGYCRNDALVDAYHAMDLLAYPMPGTDRSCRTVREALTAGVPVVASRIGFLPELVVNGKTGYVVDATPKGMAEAIRKLYYSRNELLAMSQNAAEIAVQRFSPVTYATKILAFYKKLTQKYQEQESLTVQLVQ